MFNTELTINGTRYQVAVEAEASLLAVLRNHLDLTGSKYGCGEGQCGACAVLIDGYPTRACITPVSDAVSRQVTTIEGLEQDGRLHPLQEAFLEVGAMQCAFCTSGMIISGVALLKKNPSPTKQEIVDFMEGNICRCGTYSRIISAIDKAAKTIREGSDE